jgi:uncharacterized protein (TIGR02246 family)
MKHLHRLLILSAVGCLIAGGAWLVTADENTADRKNDEQEIRQTAEAFAKAYNEGDAKAIAAEFLPDGEYIDEFKNVFKGRETIEKEFAAFFENTPGNKIEINVEEVRFIGANMAIEEGYTSLTPPDDSPSVDSRYVAVHLKQDGNWYVAIARDLEADVPTPHEHLRQLEWLLGDWIDESEDATVRTSIDWSEDGNFILANFHLETAGLQTMDGNQRIGWDPVAKQIRSWIFDSEGGFVEGVWQRAGDDWMVKVNGVSPDGTVGSSTNFYSRLDDKTIRWTTTQRIVGGELQPDVSVVMVRQPPQIGEQSSESRDSAPTSKENSKEKE